MPTTLLDLPTELIEEILRNLISVKQDVAALRLTSRALRARSSRSFKHAFFTQRIVRLEVSSLEHLFAITQHPEYGPALQDLIIRAEYHDPRHSQAILAHDNASDAQRRRAISCIERFARKQRDHQHLLDFKLGERLLVSIFRKLSKLRSLSLQYAEYDDEGTPKPMRFGAGWHSDEAKPRVSNSAWLTVMAALAMAPLPVDRLHIYKRHWGGAVTLKGLDLSLYEADGLKQVLSGLQQLRLCVCTRFNSYISTQPYPLAWPARFLSLAPNLRELDLSLCVESAGVQCADTRETCDVFRCIAQLTFPKLERCRLARMTVREPDVRRFLAHSSATLRHFEMSHVYIRRGSWSSLLFHIAHKMELESLVLWRVHELLPSVSPRCDHNNYTDKFEGDDMKQHMLYSSEVCWFFKDEGSETDNEAEDDF